MGGWVAGGGHGNRGVGLPPDNKGLAHPSPLKQSSSWILYAGSAVRLRHAFFVKCFLRKFKPVCTRLMLFFVVTRVVTQRDTKTARVDCLFAANKKIRCWPAPWERSVPTLGGGDGFDHGAQNWLHCERTAQYCLE